MFFATLAGAAVVPLIMGFIWYNPKVFGNAWMNAAGMNEEKMKGANMALIFGLTYLFSFFLAFGLNFAVIHQFGLFSMLQDPQGKADLANPDSPVKKAFDVLMATHGSSFRTYRHGALHGFLVGLSTITPAIAVNALFERKGFKYIAINAGFWIICCIIMGAIICHWQIKP
jgi:hypothetical protein